MKLDVPLRNGPQKVEKVLSVEPDLDRISVVVDRDALFALAGFGQRRMDLYLARQHAESNSPRPLIGKLRYTLDGAAQLIAIQLNRTGMVLRKDALEVREIPGQLAAKQQPATDLEKQVILVAGKLNLLIAGALLRKLQNLSHGLARQERSIRSRQIRELNVLLHHGKAMPVGCDHRDTGRLQDQQRAVQSKPRLFRGDRKDRLPDHRS